LWLNTPVNASAARSSATSPDDTLINELDRRAVDRGYPAVLRCGRVQGSLEKLRRHSLPQQV